MSCYARRTPWNPDRPAGGDAEVVLAINRLRVGEETARIERIVSQKIVDRAVKLVGSGLGGERHHAAACLTVLGLESVRIYRELGQRFDRRRVECRFRRVEERFVPTL